jgi:transposase
MGWVTMSERDLQRIEVLTDVLAGRRTVAAAATVLAISERQMYRLLAKYEDGGGSALIHKARGRQSNRSLNAGIRRYAVELVRTRYADFGPTLATEVLLEKHSLAFYSDKHSVFRAVRQDTKGGQGMTQFGRALAELNIEILCAKLQPGKRPRGTCQPNPAGQAGEGTSHG